VALSDRVDALEKRVVKLEDIVMNIANKVFNGFGDKIDDLCKAVDTLRAEISKEKERKLTQKDVWLRSLIIGVGGSLLVGVILYLLPRLL